MFGNAINFDGVDDLCFCTYATDPVDYTISAWVKPTDTTSVSIITRTSRSGPATDFFDQLRINASGQFEHFTNDGTGHTVTGTTVAQPGVWYHVVGTATAGGKMRIVRQWHRRRHGSEYRHAQRRRRSLLRGQQFGGGMGTFRG